MNYDDEQLNDFLQALDESDVDVSDWESKFIQSNLDTYVFTDNQRKSIQEMIEKYGNRIGWL